MLQLQVLENKENGACGQLELVNDSSRQNLTDFLLPVLHTSSSYLVHNEQFQL